MIFSSVVFVYSSQATRENFESIIKKLDHVKFSPVTIENTKTIETGLSDCHKMTVTILKTVFKKLPPKIVSYRNYKKFSHKIFRNEVIEKLGEKDTDEINYEQFENIIMEFLNVHAL